MPADGTYPLDNVIHRIMHEPRIQSLMFHIRAPERGRQRNESAEIDRLQREVKRLRQLTPPSTHKGSGKGAKGKKSLASPISPKIKPLADRGCHNW